MDIKKLYRDDVSLALGFTFALILLSCSNTNEEEGQQTNKSNLLIENSPWRRTHFDVEQILDSNGTDITITEIQSGLNNTTSTRLIIFNNYGTGTYVTENNGNDPFYNNFNWSVEEEVSMLKIVEESSAFAVNNNELMVEVYGEHYELGTVITFKAKVYYNKNDI